MKMNCRIIGKIGLLLVVIGFFMPIACDQNGFEIAGHMMKNDRVFEGLLIYLLFISAVIGVIIGVLLLMKQRGIKPNVDWVVIVACIASGLIVYLGRGKNAPELESGAYMILAGWIIALASQIVSKLRKEK